MPAQASTPLRLLLLACLLLPGCISLGPLSNPPFTTDTIAPGPSTHLDGLHPQGELQVFNTTTPYKTSSGYILAAPQNYRIQDATGRWRSAINFDPAAPDTTPIPIRLAPGRYTVTSLADTYRTATVPVLIRSGQRTVVNLNSDGFPFNPPPADRAVVAPDGYIVGWRSESP